MGYLRITNLQNCLQEGSRLGLQTVGSAAHPIFGSGVGSKSDQNPNGLRKAADPFRIQRKEAVGQNRNGFGWEIRKATKTKKQGFGSLSE